MSIDEAGPGLRQRKKQAMRATLSNIALRLALERGVARVRIEDIAAEAGVSPRTFNNYFPSKEAAIVDTANARAERFGTELRARPAAEPLHEAVAHAIVAVFPENPDRTWLARAQLVRADPSLHAEEAKSDAHIEQIITEEIALRIGADPERDLYPRLVAATLLAAVHVAVRHWVDNPAGQSLRQTLRRVIGQLRIEAPAA